METVLCWFEGALAHAQANVRVWFGKTIRLRPYAAHGVPQRSLTVWIFVMYRWCHKIPAHMLILESMCRSSVAPTAGLCIATKLAIRHETSDFYGSPIPNHKATCPFGPHDALHQPLSPSTTHIRCPQ